VLQIYLFGPRIRSVNVLGKAGGFVGQRGDVVLATRLLMQDTEDIIEVDNSGLDAAEIARVAGRQCHVGPCLTVKVLALRFLGAAPLCLLHLLASSLYLSPCVASA
jgi:hypothetical protein